MENRYVQSRAVSERLGVGSGLETRSVSLSTWRTDTEVSEVSLLPGLDYCRCAKLSL